MRYGYDASIPGFRPEMVDHLADAIVREIGISSVRGPGRMWLEISPEYVYIRGIGDLSDEQMYDLSARADAIYKRIMGMSPEEYAAELDAQIPCAYCASDEHARKDCRVRDEIEHEIERSLRDT